MQQWPKEMAMQDNKTYFIEKINLGLLENGLIKRIDYVESLEDYRSQFGDNWDCKPNLSPKIHTIRRDEHNRWKPGMDIHFVINSRTKDRFQFAPVIPCVSVQSIEIINAERYGINDPGISYHGTTELYGETWHFALIVKIEGKDLNRQEVEALAVNDGFESVWDFFKYFNNDFKGKLIHWTNLRY